MFEPILASLVALVTSPELMALVTVAVLTGAVFGAVPGVGGKVALVLLIPLSFGMDATKGAVFLLAMHSVVHTGSAIPSILCGVPGTGPSAATVVDGYPMAQRGEAGRAIGASLAASGVGGVIGAIALALLLPIIEPLILAFGPPEIFLLAILGITFIATLSGSSLVKGMIVGCFGLMLAFVGMDPQTGVARFSFGQLFLWDGVDIVTAILAFFAVPEVIALGIRGGSISTVDMRTANYSVAQALVGMVDVVRHRWLTLRTSVIGVVVGIIPGLGGEAASWLCYGHAVQSSRTPERFGQGAVEGVIAPEAANNSKEGGALLPTLFFGIPGSSGMVLMLGAFIMLGIQPGPQLMLSGMDLVWTLIWTLVIANLLCVVVLLALTPWIGLVAFIRGSFIIPFVLIFALLGSWLSSAAWESLVLLLAFGLLGWAFKRHGWPAPPFAIGLILGSIAEISLHRTLAIWGPSAFLRPLSLVLIALILASLGFSMRRRRNAQFVPDAA
jgi:putative tricarboxylic transport membrane protein